METIVIASHHMAPWRLTDGMVPDDCIYNNDAMDRVRYAYNNGHQVASHTWSHSDLTTLSWDQSRKLLLMHSQNLTYYP